MDMWHLSARRVASGPISGALMAAAVISSHVNSQSRTPIRVPGYPHEHIVHGSGIGASVGLLTAGFCLAGKHANSTVVLAGYLFGLLCWSFVENWRSVMGTTDSSLV